MMIFGLVFWFVLLSIFETNVVGKIILIPISIAAFVVCIPLMLGELIVLDIWVLLICLCFRGPCVADALEFLLAPLLIF